MDSSTDHEEVDGTIDHVVHRLTRWAINAPRGIAYIAYESEDSRRLAEAKWEDALHQAGMEVELLDLWIRRNPDEAIATLRAKIEAADTQALSVTGFGPMLSALGDDWSALNFRREEWYQPAVRQVWWIPVLFDEHFRKLAPDLYSWFLVKERLNESRRFDSPSYLRPATESLSPMCIGEGEQAAIKTSNALADRFHRALDTGASPEELLDLLRQVVNPLFEVGHYSEARSRAHSMIDGLFGKYPILALRQLQSPALSIALVDVGANFTNRTITDVATRLISLVDTSTLPGNRHAAYSRSLGDIALRKSDLEEATNQYKEALHLYQKNGNLVGEASCIKGLGEIALRKSGLEEATLRYEEALLIFREAGSLLGEANCIQSLGDVALRTSGHGEATRRYEEALPLFRKVGSLLGEANCIHRLGDVELRKSDHEEATRRYEEALPLYRKVGDLLGEANCIQRLGDVALERADHEEATRRYKEALPLYRKVGDLLGEANCVRGLGDVAVERLDHEEATRQYEESLILYRKVGDFNSVRRLLLIQARLPGLPKPEKKNLLHQAEVQWLSMGRKDLVDRFIKLEMEDTGEA